MKKKSIKLLIAGIVATMTMGLLVGCGGKDTSNSNNSGNNTSDNIRFNFCRAINGKGSRELQR